MFESKINRGRANGYAPLNGDGKVGLNYLPDVVGVAGTSGTSGVNGVNGSQGSSGASGTAGSSGTSGIDGSQGSSGANGTSGTSGTSLFEGVDTGSFATTGSNLFYGNQSIIGNVNLSGSLNISSSMIISSTVVNNGTIDALNTDLIIEGGYLILTGSSVPTNLTGSVGDKDGMVVFDNNFLYYCTSDYLPSVNNVIGQGNGSNITIPIVAGVPLNIQSTGWTITVPTNGGDVTYNITGAYYETTYWYLEIDGGYGAAAGTAMTLTNNNPLPEIWKKISLDGMVSINTGSFATTGSNTFIANQTIVGNVTFPSSSFISTTNASGGLYLSALNQGTLQLNADGGEGDVIIGRNGWDGKLMVNGNQIITGSVNIKKPIISIGQDLEGGKVAYILQSGDVGYDETLIQGIIAAESDEIQLLSFTLANEACDIKTTNGYSDWYLPSLMELDILHTNRVAIGGFTNDYYWSSSESQALVAWMQNFTNGDQEEFAESYQGHVRAIRIFSIPNEKALNVEGDINISGSVNMIGDQTITGSLAINDVSTNFLIEGNGFGQAYLTAGGAIVLNPGYGGVEMTGANRSFKATDITADGTLLVKGSTTLGDNDADNTTISGSLNVSGSIEHIGSLKHLGDKELSGSLNISGSTTQIGSNTLIGNTVLSGSVSISGSTIQYGDNTLIGNNTITGSNSLLGNNRIEGSNTITGNTVMSGSLSISGSQTRYGVTKNVGTWELTGSMFTSGSTTITGNTLIGGNLDLSGSIRVSGSFTGSIQIDGDLNLQSPHSFYRWGNKLFNYGSFYSTIAQSGSANVSQSLSYNNTDYSQGVSIVSGSRITLENIGIYNLQFSAQIVDTGAGDSTIRIWVKKNGTNVPNTTTKIFLKANQELVAAWNFVLPATSANDYYELVWQTTDNDAHILYEAASGNYPAVPSVILTVTQVA